MYGRGGMRNTAVVISLALVVAGCSDVSEQAVAPTAIPASSFGISADQVVLSMGSFDAVEWSDSDREPTLVVAFTGGSPDESAACSADYLPVGVVRNGKIFVGILVTKSIAGIEARSESDGCNDDGFDYIENLSLVTGSEQLPTDATQVIDLARQVVRPIG